MRRGSRVERDGPQGYGVYGDEAHALVEGDGTGVFLADVEEGFYVGGDVIAEKAVH